MGAGGEGGEGREPKQALYKSLIRVWAPPPMIKGDELATWHLRSQGHVYVFLKEDTWSQFHWLVTGDHGLQFDEAAGHKTCPLVVGYRDDRKCAAMRASPTTIGKIGFRANNEHCPHAGTWHNKNVYLWVEAAPQWFLKAPWPLVPDQVQCPRLSGWQTAIAKHGALGRQTGGSNGESWQTNLSILGAAPPQSQTGLLSVQTDSATNK